MKKNKLTDIKLTSVDLVNRGANQNANIVLYKSDTPPEDAERNVLKKAFDYLKGLFGNDEPESISKSDIAAEYDGYAIQLCKSFDSIIDDDSLSTAEKTATMQKSIQEFSAFMTGAAPIWADSHSVVKSDKRAELIAKSETPEDGKNPVFVETKKSNGKESANMPLSNLTPDEQELYKSLVIKANGGKMPPEFMVDEGEDKTKKAKTPPFVPEDDNTDDTNNVDPTKKGCKPNMKKSDIPEFILNAINKSEEFIKAQELKEMKELAKKYEVLGEKADELGEQLLNLKKADEDLYKSSIALLDRQVDTIQKSGVFTEIGKSGAGFTYNGGDTVTKVENIAKSMMEKDAELSYQEAMVKAWEAHPELAAEYETERRG